MLTCGYQINNPPPVGVVDPLVPVVKIYSYLSVNLAYPTFDIGVGMS